MAGVQTRRTTSEASSYLALLSSTKPQNVREACKDECWVKAIEEELKQIEKNNTWELIPRPKYKNVIGKKNVFSKISSMKMGMWLETWQDLFVKDMHNKKA